VLYDETHGATAVEARTGGPPQCNYGGKGDGVAQESSGTCARMRHFCCLALVALGVPGQVDLAQEQRSKDPVSVQLEIRQVSPALADTVTLDVTIINSSSDYVVFSQNFTSHLEISFATSSGTPVDVINQGKGLKDQPGKIPQRTTTLYAGRFMGRRFTYKLTQHAVGLVARARFVYDVDIPITQIDDPSAPKVIAFRGELVSSALALK